VPAPVAILLKNATIDQGAKQLDGKKRLAARDLEKSASKILIEHVWIRIDVGVEEFLRVIVVVGTHVQPDVPELTLVLLQRLGERRSTRRGRHFIGAIRANQENPVLVQLTRQTIEERNGCVIGPLHVIDDQQERLPARQLDHHVGILLRELRLIVGG